MSTAICMGSEMKVEVKAKETVIPSSPTPHPFPTHNLSYFDHVMPDMYVRLLLFYPNNNTTDQKVNTIDHQYHSLITERSKLLKTSLSEILSRFYPFAGSIVSHNNVPSICCNHHGAAFIQTRVNCPASKALGKFHIETLNHQLFPNASESTFESTGYLLLVQANFFECGGLAIGVSISHKIADGFTLGTFIRSWAAMSLGSDVLALPAAEFGVPASVNLPQPNFTNSSNTSLSNNSYYESCAIRRFVFDASKIVSLKSIAASATVPNPTRVEVVSALIWKCAMEASKSNLNFTKPSVLAQAVNMRKLLRQTNLMGNFVGVFGAKTHEGEVINLKGLVAILRKGLDEFRATYGNGFSTDNVWEYYEELEERHDISISEMYKYSSWCRFGFYEANFGWGKPSWVSTAGAQVKNCIILLDTRDGEGIEAILAFKEEDMSKIETNKELLAYASPNPNII